MSSISRQFLHAFCCWLVHGPGTYPGQWLPALVSHASAVGEYGAAMAALDYLWKLYWDC
jgi:ABC-type molybdate transport system permease subunit